MYAQLVGLAQRRMVVLFPDQVVRVSADPGMPYGRTYHRGLTFRSSGPIHPGTVALLQNSATGDTSPGESFADLTMPRAPGPMRAVIDAHAHILMPVLWAWAYGHQEGLPEHDAGEPRWLFAVKTPNRPGRHARRPGRLASS